MGKWSENYYKCKRRKVNPVGILSGALINYSVRYTEKLCSEKSRISKSGA